MTKRRLLYGVFFLVFFIVTPLLVFYASGFRYNTRIGIVQKTGAIVVSSTPVRPEVFINGELVKDIDSMRKAVRATQLLPQEYDVRVHKEGYIDWKRSVTVEPSRAVLLTHIQLFKESPEIIYLGTQNPLTQTFQETENIARVGAFDIHIATIPKAREELYLVAKQRISQEQTVLASLPRGEYTLTNFSPGWIGAHNIHNKNIYLFNIHRVDATVLDELIIPEVDIFEWHISGNKLLYYNDFELWVFNLGTSERELITRLGSGITRAMWHPSGDYAVYVNQGHIHAIELADVAQRQNHRLFDVSDLVDMQFSERGDSIYVNGTIAEQTGWFEIVIQ